MKQYRDLGPDDVIRAGDEFQSKPGFMIKPQWTACNEPFGGLVSHFQTLVFRRPITQPALKLEVGKSYRTRDGRKAQSLFSGVKRCGPLTEIVLIDGHQIEQVTPSGKIFACEDQCESPNDLIAQWLDLPDAGEGFRLLTKDDGDVLKTDECWTLRDPKWTEHGVTGYSLRDFGTIFFRRRIAPLVDWSAMPKWAKFVAMDEDARWYWYEFAPTVGDIAWRNGNGAAGIVHTNHKPSFTGDWKSSLVERPA